MVVTVALLLLIEPIKKKYDKLKNSFPSNRFLSFTKTNNSDSVIAPLKFYANG